MRRFTLRYMVRVERVVEAEDRDRALEVEDVVNEASRLEPIDVWDNDVCSRFVDFCGSCRAPIWEDQPHRPFDDSSDLVHDECPNAGVLAGGEGERVVQPEMKALDLATADPDVLDAIGECFSFGPGYMGDPAAWCYWAYDYPDEGSVGPFATEAAARDHAQATVLGGVNALVDMPEVG